MLMNRATESRRLPVDDDSIYIINGLVGGLQQAKD